MKLIRLFVLVVAACVTGCGGGDGSGRDKEVMVYSPHGEELLSAFEAAFEAAHPDIDVKWQDLPTSNCVARIRGERENPVADIWWSGPAAEFIAAAKKGLLASYKPTWSEKTTADATGADDQWYGTWRTPEVIMYHADRVSGDDIPKDWDDVLDPKWTGRVIIRDPLQSGTMKTIYGAMVLRAESVDAGFDWLRKLDKQNAGRYAATPLIMYQEIKGNAGDLTLWNMPDAFLQRKNGYPFDFVVPESGTPVVVEGIAMVNGGPNPEAAKKFYEFVTSTESLIRQAEEFDRIPVQRSDLDESKLPEWMTRQPIKAMEIDWPDFAVKSTEWITKWKNEIRGSGAD